MQKGNSPDKYLFVTQNCFCDLRGWWNVKGNLKFVSTLAIICIVSLKFMWSLHMCCFVIAVVPCAKWHFSVALHIFVSFIYVRSLIVVRFCCVYVVGYSQTFLTPYRPLVHKNVQNVFLWEIQLGWRVIRLVIKVISRMICLWVLCLRLSEISFS